MKCFGNILPSLLTIVMLYCCCEDENSKSDTTPKWEKVPVSTSDPYSDFMDVEFYNNDYGVICGGSGMILNTENGGFHWQSHKLGEGDLTSVFMLNEKEFFTGRELLYKTSNDGISFTRLGNETIFGSTLSGIYFFNSDNGLVAASSWIYKTNDGGKNWEAIFQKGFAHKFQFVTDSVGYIYGGATWDNNFYGELYKTDNCGNNWISLWTSPEVYNYWLCILLIKIQVI